MVPFPLVGRYKLYKKGTKQLVNWLAKTGSRCCDLKKVLKSMNCGFPTKKRTSKDFIEEIEVGTRELIKLAEAISDSDPPTDIPEEVIKIAQDVIKGREECADWYAAQALSGDSKIQHENDTHRYFIIVLKRVLHLLTEAREKLHPPTDEPPSTAEKKFKKSKSKNNKSVRTSDDDKLGNLYDLLSVEEPSLSPLGDEPPTWQAVASDPVPHFDFRLEKDEEDPAFATWCFLMDLADCRQFVKTTWEEYSRGEISFLAASSVTDIAFGLLRCADENFQKDNPGCPTANWNDLVSWLGLTFFARNNTVWLCPAVIGSEPYMPDSEVNMVDLLSPIAVLCLRSYSEDAAEICKAAKENKPFPSSCADGHFHRFHEFCCVLFDLAPELHSASHHSTCEHLVVDEFVQGLSQMHRDGNMPLWLVVACQIYLDIKDLLGSHTSHGVEALQDTFRRNKALREEIVTYSAECGDDFSDVGSAIDKLDWVSRACNRFDEAVLLPHEGSHQSATKKHKQIKEELGCSASPMERELPAHAGAIMADLKFGLLDAGCKIANHGLIVLSAAHLYKALRAMDALECDWPDMDFVLSTFKNKKPLVAKMGSNYDGNAAARHYLMALGIQAKDLARTGRKGRLVLKDARKITITSPFLQKMSDRQQTWQKHGLGYSKSRTMEVVLQTLAPSPIAEDKQIMETRSQLQTSFTPLQLMSTYKRTLLADEPALNFNYIGFTIACARLLNLVSQQIGAKLGLKGWVEGKLGLKSGETVGHSHVDLVYRLLRAPAGSSDVNEAASLFEEHINKAGKNFTKQAYDQSSGRIPKDLRPNMKIDHEDIAEERRFLVSMLKHSNTKYMFSGKTMAAYHPKVKPEPCTKDCCGKAPPGGDTEPGEGKLNAFGAALPNHILEEGIASQKQELRSGFGKLTSDTEDMFKKYAHDQLSESQLRQQVKKRMGFDIEPMIPNEFRLPCTPWVYIVIPDEQTMRLYDHFYWNVLVQHGCMPQAYGGPLRVPADLMDINDMFNMTLGIGL